MKIKEVCQKTSLTDRTIRYYIEEGLINPSYTENYLGRKSFEFSEEDISQLDDIAILRNFGFSVEEIRGLIQSPENSCAVIQRVKQRTAENLEENQKRFSALAALPKDRMYTVSDLAKELSLSENPPATSESVALNVWKILYTYAKQSAIFVVVWLPIVLSIITLLTRIGAYQYPMLHPMMIVCTLASFAPSVMMLILPKRKKKHTALQKNLLLFLCTFCIPISVFCSFGIVSECEHNWNNFTTEYEVTCGNAGIILRECKYCRATDRATVDSLPHTVAFDSAKEATCTETGLSEGTHCSVCGTVITAQKEIAKTPHTVVTDGAIAPTCTQTGRTEGSHCSVCNEVTKPQTVLEKVPHAYVKSSVEPTCGTRGYTLYECSECGDSYIEDVVHVTNQHTFEKNSGTGAGYKCVNCKLLVFGHGNADCSWFGGNERVKYFVTGANAVKDKWNNVIFPAKTLIIYGNPVGLMSDLEYGQGPDWSEYSFTGVIIEKGVRSIGQNVFNAYKGDINYYEDVKFFIIRDPNIDIGDRLSYDMKGIKCKITYEY